MRYTARTRSIVWKDNTSTVAAVRFLEQLLADDSSLVLRYRLAAGEGLICNNVLHNRTAFRDNEQGGARRLLYRARYSTVSLVRTRTKFLDRNDASPE